MPSGYGEPAATPHRPAPPPPNAFREPRGMAPPPLGASAGYPAPAAGPPGTPAVAHHGPGAGGPSPYSAANHTPAGIAPPGSPSGGFGTAPAGPGGTPQFPAAPESSADPAMLHRTELTRTYPCPACGGQLVFDIASQQLRCPSCGNYSPLSAPRAPVVARDLRQAMGELRALQAVTAGPQVTGDREVKCQNCGGTTTFVGSLTATRCPYCATPIQRDDVHNAPARLPVDGVLPFRIDEKAARERVEKWIAGRWFAPTAFKNYKRLGSLASVYHAYFTYDADVHTWYRGERGDEYTERYWDDGELKSRTEIRWYPVMGEVGNRFDDLPILANDIDDSARVAELEPWPVAEATGYSPEYVAGHLARTYDRDAEEMFPVARTRMEQAIEQTVREDIGGDRQHIHDLRSTWNSLAYKHILLPIWLLTVVYANTPFRVYINGLTGEVIGQRPWSKGKLAAFVTVVTLLIIGAVVALSMWHGGGTHHHSTGHTTVVHHGS
ncbi:hypothetical protein [Nocardia nova]|uniref:hypothetical protein n=2 Tax=Nocardia nova TaxID=37330 RepID=UPI0015E36EE4|nr:hypothetical protein [Nocardia nova]